MGYWEKPNKFKVCNFIEIPMGMHKVKIANISMQTFSKSKKKCFEITLEVSGHPGKLWYYLWYSPDNLDRTNANFEAFFNGFQIEEENRNLRRYKRWIGKTGGVHVWHEHGPTKYLKEDEYEAIVTHVLNVRECDKLPPWSDVPLEKSEAIVNTSLEELPF